MSRITKVSIVVEYDGMPFDNEITKEKENVVRGILSRVFTLEGLPMSLITGNTSHTRTTSVIWETKHMDPDA